MLSLLSYLYLLILKIRLFLYEKRILRSRSLGLKTISIGNITTGGTGKTPVTILFSKLLSEKNLKVCVLTRGYKRKNPRKSILVSKYGEILADAELAGDEPLEIARKTKASVIADANRIRAASWAIENLKPDVFLLDDAFQHLKVHRDLNIVLIDALNPFGNYKLLPAGILREPLSSLQRADVFLLTKTNLVEPNELVEIEKIIRLFNPSASIFRAEIEIEKIRNLKNETEAKNLSKQNFLAVCGIANPESFFRLLQKHEFNLTGKISFPDHHAYSAKDVEKISFLAKKKKADAILVTAKDAVKLERLNLSSEYFVVETSFKFSEDFTSMILQTISQKSHPRD